jgi:putative addiction module killer protein
MWAWTGNLWRECCDLKAAISAIHKSVGGGVWEARLDFGPGYRLYFAKDGVAVVLLLVGGDKGSQSKDIAAAKRYWQDFREAKHGKAQ